jgi:TatD DNase family protein
MILHDTHTHLYAEEFDLDRDTVVVNCLNAGITKLYMPNVDSGSIKGMMDLAGKYPDNCIPMMGLHPCSVKEDYQQELNTVKEWLKKRSFCAIGEIGMDLYWDKTFIKEQEIAFRTQVEWALQYDIPFVIHSRESFEEIYTILIAMQQEKGIAQFKGIFHCFSGTLDQAERAIALGFYLGIGGVVTFKNAGLDKVVAQLNLQNIVLETDSPYLTPIPYRGKRNESTYLLNIAEKVADLHHTSIENIANITTFNSQKLFNQ